MPNILVGDSTLLPQISPVCQYVFVIKHALTYSSFYPEIDVQIMLDINMHQ